MDALKEVFELFHRNGGFRYAPHAVTYEEHALQAAALAAGDLATSSLVAAALLHDVGHLLSEPNHDLAGMGRHDHHEQLGYEWLSRYFGPAVAEPVRLHVDAKRYLCAIQVDYLDQLSASGLGELAAQGGPMSREEVDAFEVNPFFSEVMWLRRIDDGSRVPGKVVAPLTAYKERLEDCLLPAAA